jgi:hypothetical protein
MKYIVVRLPFRRQRIFDRNCMLLSYFDALARSHVGESMSAFASPSHFVVSSVNDLQSSLALPVSFSRDFSAGEPLRLSLPRLSLRLSRFSDEARSSFFTGRLSRLGGVRERERWAELLQRRRRRGGEREPRGEPLRERFLGGGEWLRLEYESDRRRRWWSGRLGDRERRL